MKKENKIFNKIMSRILSLLFIFFVILYIYKTTGYYEYYNHQQVELTNDEIKEFENDIKEGKNVKIKDYIDAKTKNYDNLVSNIGYTLSEQIGNFTTNGIDTTMDFLAKLFNG